MSHHTITRRAWLVAAVATVTALALGTPASAGDGHDGGRGHDREVTVATYNVDFGADLKGLFNATNLVSFVTEAATAYGTVKASNYTDRADLVAAQLIAARPDIVGLQEVAVWAETSLATGKVTTLDYQSLLLAALARRGAVYDVAVRNVTFVSPTVPVTLDQKTVVQFTDTNLILVRHQAHAKVLRTGEGQYDARMVLTKLNDLLRPIDPTANYAITRGWAWADLLLNGSVFRVFTTHLEAYSDVDGDALTEHYRNLQATELAAMTARSPHPVLLTGDFNSRPTCTAHNTVAYDTIVAAGFTEVWPATHRRNVCTTGYTSGDRASVTGTGVLDHRIDHIFFERRHATALSSALMGARDTDKTSAGLWASDHAGSVATLVFERGHDRH